MTIENNLKQDHNEETARAHLKNRVTQTKAEAAADAHANENHIPPDDVSYSTSVNKKVRGRPKGARNNPKVIYPNNPSYPLRDHDSYINCAKNAVEGKAVRLGFAPRAPAITVQA